MIPLLLISNNKSSLNLYVNKLKKEGMFFEVTPSTKEYSIDDIKSIIKETKVFYPKIRNYFFPDFHLSSIPAQNSFLKLLEEPPSNVQFILSTDNKNRLLPTIISRVKIVKLQNDVGAIHESSDTMQFITPLIEGLKIPLTQFKITDKESAKNILLQLIIFFREKLDTDKKSPPIIKEILRLDSLLDSNNLNPQLTIDQVLIFIWKQYKMK
jgi:hypothetical protein